MSASLQRISFDVLLDDYSSTVIQDLAPTVLEYFLTSTASSITSTVQFSNDAVINQSIAPEALSSTAIVSDTARVAASIRANSVINVNQFGDLFVNMEIEGVPFPSIESTVVIPNPVLKVFTQPLSIASTTNFGTAVFIDNIHRMLVFKNDNISKIGPNDAAVIAGGIRLNPATTITHEATSGQDVLPSNPAGFLAVTINGQDFKIPYYNA